MCENVWREQAELTDQRVGYEKRKKPERFAGARAQMDFWVMLMRLGFFFFSENSGELWSIFNQEVS